MQKKSDVTWTYHNMVYANIVKPFSSFWLVNIVLKKKNQVYHI